MGQLLGGVKRFIDALKNLVYDLLMSYIYRFFDASGGLIYLGLTNALDRRIKAHLRSSAWAMSAAEVEYEEWSELRKIELHRMETELIRKERPKKNAVKPVAIEIDHIDWLKLCAQRSAIIKRMAKNGMTLAEIGDQLGISRQRVHQIVRAPAPSNGARKKLGLSAVKAKFRAAQIERARKFLARNG